MTNPLSDIRHYSPTMTMTQLMKFFEKKNIGITRAMIQNYIRDGLLPSPLNKRFYTHKHLAALVMIDRLKTVFDMPTIQRALKPYMDDEGLPLDKYSELMEKTGGSIQKLLNVASVASEDDGGVLLTMSCAAELKAIIMA